MNKLILIGNGFDLAHGLPTSYRDFLNDFWENFQTNIDKLDDLFEINKNYNGYFNFAGNKIECFDDFVSNLKGYCNDYKYSFDEQKVIAQSESTIIFKFKNDFFKTICVKNAIENWVDIENEYYSELKKIAKKHKEIIFDTEDAHTKYKKKLVLKLNKEFGEVIGLLKEYLEHKIQKTYNFNNVRTHTQYSYLLEVLSSNNFFALNPGKNLKSDLKKYSDEFSLIEDQEEIKNFSNDIEVSTNKHIKFETLFLNFNYTSIILHYQRTLASDGFCNYSINNIHGDLSNMVFGYGDEMDLDYKLIEDIDDNEYLKFFKSFQYFQNNCYDKLLKYIDSAKFQVYIMGHSCGLSDRIMLSTIFEHENCRSIKIYYHEEKDPQKDNYLDIVKNISRHFKEKQSMRRKIVNKELSDSLRQDVRFEKN